jgi:alanine dehydrogenase
LNPEGTLLLGRRDVERLLDLDECIAAVEEAFRLLAQGRAIPSGILGFPYPDGGFHIKAAGLDLAQPYFAAKINGNFFRNRERFGLPAIQGIVLLSDGRNGRPLALMDSSEITTLRTGAATAVAARVLARPDSSVVTVCGCGNQGRAQLRALARVLPIAKAYAFDMDADAAERFARELGPALEIDIESVRDPGAAVRGSDVCVTCTPSRRPFLRRSDVRAGTFLAAVGADAPEKRELETEILTESRLVVDSLEQCATIGELHHALEEGALERSAVHAELSEIVGGAKPGRESAAEITVFDSTGVALEDVAAAAAVYEKAIRAGVGLVWKSAE